MNGDWLQLLAPALSTAFLAGLLGSGHCFGMCGGIAGGLGAMAASPRRAEVFAAAALFNGGRVLTYGFLGGVAALLIGAAGSAMDVPGWSRVLRLLTAVMILLIGLRYLFGWNAVAWIERAGGGLWKRISPLAMKAASRPGPGARLALGLSWGFLPCGLVYTMLLTAASTGSFTGGALVMLAFGVGTLPSMLGLTVAAPALGSFLGDRWTQRVIGASMVLLAAWSLVVLYGAGAGGGHHHH
jgi:sulfite exporter TauE/SafE